MGRSPDADPSSFLPLRPVELHVLLSLGRRPRHGYGIMQDAAARTGEEVIPDVGTLYRALRRMVDEGLIEPSPTPDDETDARRNYYALTELGRAVAVAEARRMTSLLEAARLQGFLGTTGEA